MTIKPGKTRITFTTEDEFSDFLLYLCKKENRNMSNLVDTYLKELFEKQYKEYLKANHYND